MALDLKGFSYVLRFLDWSRALQLLRMLQTSLQADAVALKQAMSAEGIPWRRVIDLSSGQGSTEVVSPLEDEKGHLPWG